MRQIALLCFLLLSAATASAKPLPDFVCEGPEHRAVLRVYEKNVLRKNPDYTPDGSLEDGYVEKKPVEPRDPEANDLNEPDLLHSYCYAYTDLNEDGREEVIITAMTSWLCGSAGCATKIYEVTPEGAWRAIFIDTVPTEGMEIAPAAVKGKHGDLSMEDWRGETRWVYKEKKKRYVLLKYPKW